MVKIRQAAQYVRPNVIVNDEMVYFSQKRIADADNISLILARASKKRVRLKIVVQMCT